MVICWLIMKGNHPSMTHCRYLVEAEASTEADRLEKIRVEENSRIETNPATGHGACFLNMKDNEPWTYERREFPA